MIYPVLQPTDNNKFILQKKYKYKGIEIPVKYETNGADIPRPFWVIVPPFKPKFFPAVLVHDFLIEKAKSNEDILIANDYFEEILLQIENSFKTKVMVRAVKLYWRVKIKFKVVKYA
jgi:hypothetical protein